MIDLYDRVGAAMAEAERKAWDSLARYKFQMFGYHAAQWVLLNRLLGGSRGNPFRGVVALARAHAPGELHAPADVEIPGPPR